MAKGRMTVIGAVVMVTACCGCASLMLKEKERALDEAFDKGKITKTEYYSSIGDLQREKARKGLK